MCFYLYIGVVSMYAYYILLYVRRMFVKIILNCSFFSKLDNIITI